MYIAQMHTSKGVQKNMQQNTYILINMQQNTNYFEIPQNNYLLSSIVYSANKLYETLHNDLKNSCSLELFKSGLTHSFPMHPFYIP